MRFFSRVFLPFLLLSYIGVETYLKTQNTSLCGEVGCKLAGELLRFNPIYLNYTGFIGIFFLMIFGYRSLKSSFFEGLFFLVLYSAIAFEATIIAYQFIANPEPCLFCLGIFSSLLLIAFFSSSKHFPIVLAGIFAILVGLSTLSLTKNKAYATSEGLYLIQSESCAHCKKVKTYFSKEDIKYTAISVKEANARSFLKFINISSIPALVMKESSGIHILTGDKKIIAHFEAKKKAKEITQTEVVQTKVLQTEVSVPQETAIQSSNLNLGRDFFSAGAVADEGCSISIVETPSCEDDNESH